MAGGVWSITATVPLTVGVNALTAKQTDLAGNVSAASAALNVTLETTALAPTALALTPGSDSGISNSDDVTNVALPTVTGAGTNGDTVTLFNGTAVIGTGTVAGGAWSITATVPLTVGSNAITAKQTDVAGNVSIASSPLDVTLVTTILPPAGLALAPSGSSSSRNVTNLILPSITGTGENGATVTLFDGGVAAGTATVTGGVWSVADTIPLTQTAANFTASQTDVAGNVSALSTALSVTLDNPPIVTAALVANALNTHSGGMVFSQTISGGGNAERNGNNHQGGSTVASTQASATGAWSFDPSVLSQGAHTLVGSETTRRGRPAPPLP